MTRWVEDIGRMRYSKAEVTRPVYVETMNFQMPSNDLVFFKQTLERVCVQVILFGNHIDHGRQIGK